MKETFISTIENGKIRRIVAEGLADYIKGCGFNKIVIDVYQYKAKRSDAQNRYWWSVVTILSKEIGYHKEEMHEILKFKFLKRSKVDGSTGELFEYLGSTASLNKMEFSELTQQLIQWSAETFNIILPTPGENFKINFNQ